ncbi:MAG: response regulator [Nitrospirota bacterium]|nr:response regulator [Nitrospirota bacterium]
MALPRILLVDDDPVLLQVLPETLRMRMPELMIDTCLSGLQALDRLRTSDYDAVISDIKMPNLDGLALLEKIQARWPNIPIILMTGHGEEELANRGRQSGAFDFIHKPIERDAFVESVRRAIRARHVSRI